MTIQVTKQEAIDKIEELLDRAFHGDEVVITTEGLEPVRLKPPIPTNGVRELQDNPPYIVNGKRIPGCDAGLVIMTDDFNDPLPEEILRAFEGDA
jgi:antitoxin (DNA-binding transcriptional repressor) of toxin-antitoxin stability system